MEESYLKEVEREIEGLRYVCSKIIQAYRIRMKLFLRRYELLNELDKNFDNLANNPNFYSELDNILRKERKLLSIIEGDEKKVGNNLVHAITQLESYNSKLGGKLMDTHLGGWAKKLSARDIDIFLRRMISFLKIMEHDLRGIERRLTVEDAFIREKTQHHFNEFIKAWEEEMKAHERLIKDFDKALDSSQKIIHTGERAGEALIAGGTIGGLTAALAGVTLNVTAASVLGGAVGATIVMGGFMVYFSSISKTGLQYVRRDKVLIKDFEEKRKIEKHSFLHKLFGR